MSASEQTAILAVAPAGRPRRPRPPMATLVAVALASLAALVLGVTLAGDDGGRVRTVPLLRGSTTTPTEGREPSAHPATDPSPAPTVPSPTTQPPATVPQWLTSASRLSLDGIGPVDIGMTLEQASAAAGVPIRLLDTPAGPVCRFAVPDRSSGTGDELGFMVLDGRIVRVDVGRMGPDRVRTVSGIGKGNTEAEVQATYPGRIRVEPHPSIPNGRNLVYVPNDPALGHLRMIFETVDGTVRAFRAGLAEQISWTEGCS